MSKSLETAAVPEAAGGSRQTAIEVCDLRKTYGSLTAVDNVSFAVMSGEIFGILGPNGAGKTTTLEIIEGLRQPDSGSRSTVRVDGLDVGDPRQRHELHQRIGLQLQTSALFDELTVRENLEMLAALYRRPRPVKDLLREFNLEEKAGALLSTLSGGQKQRVSLAAAMINDPALLFLDEPTTALDPQARRNIWDTLRHWQAAGKTVILTTHYMEEAEKLCDRVAIMDNGRIVALGTPARLIGQYAAEQTITCRFAAGDGGPALNPEALSALPGITRATGGPDRLVVHTTDLTAAMIALLRQAEREGVSLTEITTHSPTLEDVFINLTGKDLRS